MKILAIDVSSACSGYCILEDGYLDIGSVNTIVPRGLKQKDKLTLGQKLLFFENSVKAIIKKYKPNLIVVEDIFKGPNAKTFKTLAAFRGVAFKICQQLTKKDPISLMPTEARKLINIKGKKKEDAFEFVVKKYKLKHYVFEKDNDKTDAIVLALAAEIFMQENKNEKSL